MIIATTDRLIIREFRDDDLCALMRLVGDPEVMRFSVRGPWSPEKAKEFISGCIRGYAEKGFDRWALDDKETNDFIGFCGYFDHQIADQTEHEMGYR